MNSDGALHDDKVSRVDFVFAGCQPGAEIALKDEVTRKFPAMRPAYSRPGFVTFKTAGKISAPTAGDSNLSGIFSCAFARVFGDSLGKVSGADHREKAAAVGAFARENDAAFVHVWSPAQGQEESPEGDALAASAAEAVRAHGALGGIEVSVARAGTVLRSVPGTGDIVLDVVVVSADEWWAGVRKHSRLHRPWAGGIAPIALALDAPSRAYLKTAEALAWPGLDAERGETVLELGSAPGGGSLAWLERGLKVIGVDPGAMDERIVANPAFRHLRKQSGQVTAGELAGGCEWIASDMNIEPGELLKVLPRLVRLAGPGLRGGMFTLKLKSWRDTKPAFDAAEQLAAIGLGKVQLTHLFHNRTELCAVVRRR